MYIKGHLFVDNGYWIAAIPLLDCLTQGCTAEDATHMAADWVESMVSIEGFSAAIEVPYDSDNSNEFVLHCNSSKEVIALALRRQRTHAGMSAVDLAKKLGMTLKSIMRYESGACEVSLAKFEEILKLISSYDLVLTTKPKYMFVAADGR